MSVASSLLAGTTTASENVLVPKLSELLIGTLSFGLLVAFFFWKVAPQIKKAYAERTERIEGGIERAEQAQAEASALLTQYRAQLDEARTEAGRIREEAREQARQITDDLKAQAERDVADLRARASEQIAADRVQTVTQLRRELGEIALDLATRIVGHELERDSTQRQLVDDFLAGLDESPSVSAGAPGPSGPGS